MTVLSVLVSDCTLSDGLHESGCT